MYTNRGIGKIDDRKNNMNFLQIYTLTLSNKLAHAFKYDLIANIRNSRPSRKE